MKLYPPKEGLKHDWQPGEVAVRSSHGFPHSYVLAPLSQHGYVCCLDSSGIVNFHSPAELLTIEGALKTCEYMREIGRAHV